MHNSDKHDRGEIINRMWTQQQHNELHRASGCVPARASTVFMVITLLFTSTCFGTETHPWRVKDGAVYSGDRPLLDTPFELIASKPNVSEDANVENLSIYPDKDPEVILYSTAWCGYCRRARSYFRSNNIEFTEYDVEKTAKGKRDYKRLGARGVPVILIGKKRLNSFSAASFEKIYRAR